MYPPVVFFLLWLLAALHGGERAAADGMWCVSRSDASNQALQAALDYACGSGADCGPIQPSGLCYLPNTLQAHASYAFNSYFQRKFNAPGSCDFSGTAAIAKTEPSYGSCVYPSNPRNAGGATNPGGGFGSMVPPPPLLGMTNQGGYGYGIGGGVTPNLGPVDDTDSAPITAMIPPSITTLAVSLCSYIVLTCQQRCMEIWHW